MMKNQINPNYINKVKQKKLEAQKKKPNKSALLNLTIPIKGEQQFKKYEIFGELGKGAYGLVRMGVDRSTN